MPVSRREWLRQGSMAALGLGLSLRSLANEEGLARNAPGTEGLINLGSNENPYGISPKAREVIKALLGEANRYQYNVASIRSFKKELADYHKVGEDQVLITPGSGEGLGLLARYFSEGNIVTADPTFGILPNTAGSIGTKVIKVPLTGKKVHDLPAMLGAIHDKTSLVYICNPANPTATMLTPQELKDFCREASKKTTVLIDEAYIDYLDAPYNESMAALTADNPRVIVINTFSKIHAMAGLRIGFTIGHPTVIRKLADNFYQRSQYACSVLSLGAAQASLKDEAHLQKSKKWNDEARAFTHTALKEMGYTCYPSFTNFLFFKLNDYSGDFASDMLKQNILLRSAEYADGKWCRVSIGTMEEMKQFVTVLKRV